MSQPADVRCTNLVELAFMRDRKVPDLSFDKIQAGILCYDYIIISAI